MKTLNAAAAKYNSISLIIRILCGLVIGAVLALTVPGAGWVAELGTLFVGALKGIAPVLVFVIVASALAQGSSKLDRRFGTVIWLYMLTTFLAAAIASVTSFLFPVTVVLADAAESDVIPQGLGEVLNTLLANFVANPVSAIMNGNYIGILFWACLFGLAMKKIGAESTKVFLSNTADAVSKIVRWIINLAPFGIMGLVYSNVSSNGLSIFTQYGKLLALLVGTMLFMALIVSPLIMFLYLGCNPYPLVFRCLKESGLTAFFTRSSAANIPVNMVLCHHQHGRRGHHHHHHDAGSGQHPGHSGLSARRRCPERHERPGCLRRIRCGGRLPAAHSHGLLPVWDLQRHCHADGRCRFHHRRGAGLRGNGSELRRRRGVCGHRRVSPVAQGGQAPAGLPPEEIIFKSMRKGLALRVSALLCCKKSVDQLCLGQRVDDERDQNELGKDARHGGKERAGQEC